MLSFFDQRVIESILMFLCQLQVKPYNIGVSVVFPPDTDTPGFENENKGKVRKKLVSFHFHHFMSIEGSLFCAYYLN